MWWTSLISLLTKIGEFIVSAYEQRKRVKTVEEKQDEYDKLEEDPAGWFNKHFSGVRRGNTHEAADGGDVQGGPEGGPGEANPPGDRPG